MIIGITGGIGSGKSTIAAELSRRGYPVYDTDSEAKRIIVHNPAVRSQVETLFGSDVFDGDTYLTEKVAAQVFANPDLLHRLNAIVHPAVRFDLEHWIKANNQQSDFFSGGTVCFVESAILFESGLNTLCDKIIYVDAPEDVRVARVIARDHTDADQVLARIRVQKDDARDHANIVLLNDGSKSVPDLVDSLTNNFYFTALKLMSSDLYECVSAPTDTKSTPHNA